jgi:trehalose 6-phosphate synthase
MRLSFRLIFSLILGLTLVSLLFAAYQVELEKRGLRKDLQRRAEVLAESLAQNVEPLLEKSSHERLQRMVERFGNREHLDGVAIYDNQGSPVAVTSGLTKRLVGRPATVARAIAENKGHGEFLWSGETSVHIYALPLHRGEDIVGGLAIVHDAAYIEAESTRVWHDTVVRVLIQGFLVALITLLIVRWSIVGPIAKIAQWMKALRMGRATLRPNIPDWDLFKPLAHEVRTFAESLVIARASADREARLREAADSFWTAERLSVHVRSKLKGTRLFVVSNREPYTHRKQAKSIEAIVPASGLVTALEPILRACDGTWIAHGSGDADRDTVDKGDRLRVPPEDPKYTLRRVWLTEEEEEGYYFGFANEGLWPLCHIAHTRPIFRTADWVHYQEVNEKFAKAVLDEMDGVENPVLLVQDYHFALLPRIVKEKRADARVAIFWHIPWPNPEAFGICPWQRELLEGLLGADLIGFHVQSHCNNFLETVDGALESRIEWERFAVDRGDHFTIVKPFPISVVFTEATPESAAPGSASRERYSLFKELGVDALFLGVGVDRVDYTKGILERFLAIERLLEKHPVYMGKFTFVQIGAPSRTHIKRYHDLLAEVEAEAERINGRFQTGTWRPIIFLDRHHSHREIDRFYRAADLCLVTSLHDGMNLVAKEFLAARHDEQGMLILSRFTGACRELRDAVLVNPYDVEQMAEAIRFGLEMDPEEKRARVRRMRQQIKEQNIYRWAANLVSELCEVRLKTPETVNVPAKGHRSTI